MATFTVTTAADVVNAGDGVLSLREAVQQANATTAADTIQFANVLESQTLTLTQGQLTLAGDPEGSSNRLTVDGDANDNGSRVTISGGDQSRVLAIQDGADVSISGLSISDGRATTGSGAGISIGEHCSVRIDASRIASCYAGDASYYGAPSQSGGGISVGQGLSLA